MASQSDLEKTLEGLRDNGRYQSSEHADVFKRKDADSLMVDKDGFVKEIGKGTWRPYNPDDDRPNS